MSLRHVPVMAEEIVGYLNCMSGRIYVDATVGFGGHTLSILKATEPDGRVIGLDVDEEAIGEALRGLEPYKERVEILRENYKDIKAVLRRLGRDKVDGIVFDLGVSSWQLEKKERGFSFLYESRLDMRMDKRREVSAYELVNKLSMGELEMLFRRYGEERRARAIAKAIEKRRRIKPIETTTELSEVVKNSLPPALRRGRIHPATKVFQALRIAVNNELENLKIGLKDGIGCLNVGGRMVVISFHSLEDRIVKETFREFSAACVCPKDFPRCVCGRKPEARILTKKVLLPAAAEVEENPRARSARLRAMERI